MSLYVYVTVEIKQTTIFVTVSIQHSFEKNPNKTITTKIHTSKFLISKLIMTVSRFRIRVVAMDIKRYCNFMSGTSQLS